MFSIYLYFQGNKINFKKFLFLNLFFIVNIISLLYSNSLKDGFTRIEGYLPLLYITFSYFVLLKTDIKFNKVFLNNWDSDIHIGITRIKNIQGLHHFWKAT